MPKRDPMWNAIGYFRELKTEMLGEPEVCSGGVKYYDSGDAKYKVRAELRSIINARKSEYRP